MISESELYWVLKLDDIRTTLTILSTAGAFLSAAGSLIFTAAFLDGDRRFLLLAVVSYLGAFLCVIGFVAAMLVPSTKQYAVIKVFPAIATQENLEALTKETKEIYTLAKEYFLEKKEDNQ